MDLVDFIGLIGFWSGFILLVSPARSIYEGIKKMEIKSLTFEYFLLGAMQASLFAIFGHKNDDLYVYLLNDLVVIFFVTYLNAILYINGRNKEIVYYDFSLFFGIVFLYNIISGTFALLMASIINTVWQFSTLRNIKQSLAHKDASYINIMLAYVSFTSSTAWATYSLMTQNYLMFFPNLCGTIMWQINILIYYWTKNYVGDDNIEIKVLKFLLGVQDEEVGQEILTRLSKQSSARQLLTTSDF